MPRRGRPAAPSWGVPTARAPGRVTIIGDHTDYNAGVSLPMAIELATEVTFTAKPGSFLVGVESDQFPDEPSRSPWPIRTATGSHADALLAAGLLRLWPPPGGAGGRVAGDQHGARRRRPLFQRRLLGGPAARPRPRSRSPGAGPHRARRRSAQPGPTSACSIRSPSPAPGRARAAHRLPHARDTPRGRPRGGRLRRRAQRGTPAARAPRPTPTGGPSASGPPSSSAAPSACARWAT